MTTITLTRDRTEVGRATLDDDDYIHGIRIYAAYRGHGYCRPLVQKVINRASQRGMARVWLTVAADNMPAIKCYRGCGFRITKKNRDGGAIFGYTMGRSL